MGRAIENGTDQFEIEHNIVEIVVVETCSSPVFPDYSGKFYRSLFA